MSNLPLQAVKKRSDKEINQFYDRYYSKQLSFSSSDVDSVIGFFTKRGFEESSAIAVGTTLLEQSKIDEVPIFKVLDTLNGLEELQLSAVVTEILNYNRSRTSVLGYKRDPNTEKIERRNIQV